MAGCVEVFGIALSFLSGAYLAYWEIELILAGLTVIGCSMYAYYFLVIEPKAHEGEPPLLSPHGRRIR